MKLRCFRSTTHNLTSGSALQCLDHSQFPAPFRCCSYVGRQKKGGQKMKLDHGCMVHGILLHELGHVIGFWHEQNRPDRDRYIEVLPNYHVSYSNVVLLLEREVCVYSKVKPGSVNHVS